MYKSFIIGIALLLSLSLSAQDIEGRIDLVQQEDSVDTHKKKTNFITSVINFVSGDFDPKYVSPNKYDLAFMTTYFNNNEYYSLKSTDPKNQTLRFSPDPSNKIGFYFGWRFIFLGWSFDVDDIFHKS